MVDSIARRDANQSYLTALDHNAKSRGFDCNTFARQSAHIEFPIYQNNAICNVVVCIKTSQFKCTHDFG